MSTADMSPLSAAPAPRRVRSGLRPRPPPAHQLQRRLYTCPHTKAVRVALSRTAPPARAAAEPEDGSFGAAMRQLHAIKCSARLRQLPHRRLPHVAMAASTAAAAVDHGRASTADGSAAGRASTAQRPRPSASRGATTIARTLAAEQGRGAAVMVARELVDDVVDGVVAAFGFAELWEDGEARVSTAESAVQSARVHDHHGYRVAAKDRLIERIHTPGSLHNSGRSAGGSAACGASTRRGQAAPESEQPRSEWVATPPADWGFVMQPDGLPSAAAGADRASNPWAIDSARQRHARRRIGLLSAMDPWATDTAAVGPSVYAPYGEDYAQQQPHAPSQPPKPPPVHRLSAASRAVRIRGSAVLSAKMWANRSTPEAKRVPDPVARPYPFAGRNPAAAKAADEYVYPAVPANYHLSYKPDSDIARQSTPLGEASYSNIQVEKLQSSAGPVQLHRRTVKGHHTPGAHARAELLREGPSSKWIRSSTGRLVIDSAAVVNRTRSVGVSARESGQLPRHFAGKAWAAAMDYPVTERGYSRGSAGLVETPLTMRHVLQSAGAMR